MDIPDMVPCIEDRPRTCLLPDYSKTLSFHVGTPKQMKIELIGGVGYNVNDKLSIQLTAYPTRVLNLSREDFAEDIYSSAPRDSGPGILKGYSSNLSVLYTF
jgi:hypothetical protein